MDVSLSSQSDVFSQSLPTVEGLDLDNSDEVIVDTLTCDKHLPNTQVVTSNQVQLTVNCCEGNKLSSGTATKTKLTTRSMTSNVTVKTSGDDRDSQVVMLPGDQGDSVPGEAQKSPDKASLPYVDNCIDTTGSHHQDGVADVNQHGGKHLTQRKSSQQQQKKNVHYPARVTRSTSRLIAQLKKENTKQRSDYGDQTVDNSSDDQSCYTSNTCGSGQIKYNKSKGFSAQPKVTNWTRSEINGIFTNNGTKCKSYQSRTMNSNDGNNGSHFVDCISTDSFQPLQDVSNSNDKTTARPVHSHNSQGRVYDLVAGKKSRKGKRQQLRKAAPLVAHKKKLSSSSEGIEITKSSGEQHLESADSNNTTCVRPHHEQASQEHSKHSGELVS